MSQLTRTLLSLIASVISTVGVTSLHAPALPTPPAMGSMSDESAGPPCGDLNDDGLVDLSDLLVVLSHFGSDGPAGDVNLSGSVNFADIVLVLVQWGGTCG